MAGERIYDIISNPGRKEKTPERADNSNRPSVSVELIVNNAIEYAESNAGYCFQDAITAKTSLTELLTEEWEKDSRRKKVN